MSTWSHIEGLVRVTYCGKNVIPFKDILDSALDESPEIGGVKGSATIKIIDYGKSSASPYIPCDLCKYFCNNQCSYKICTYFENKILLPLLSTTNSATIYISGELEDLDANSTKVKFKNWIKYMKSIYNNGFKIETVFIKIKD
jgi:hypothetical protein